ncbi:Uma2 family endonuclease [Anaerolineales bacterium HSG25]|nr:Uma2 family endonuclease [Anaerolineales bacterium HSG25]
MTVQLKPTNISWDVSPVKQVGSEDGKYVSEAVYWEQYYGHPEFNYEWKNGYLQEKPMADFINAYIYRWFLQLLEQFLINYPIADISLLEIGFRLELPDDKVIRKPDLGIVLKDNPVEAALNDRTYKGVFDLCVESLSDSTRKERERDTVEKLGEYEIGGVQEYYILHNSKTYTRFYHRTVWGSYVPLKPTADGVIQSDVLPGFQFRIKDLYTRPSLQKLVNDPVYQGFIMRPYQQERALVKQERQQVEQERQRAEKAEQELEQYRAKLKALGIELDE